MAPPRITDAALGADLRRMAQQHGRLTWRIVRTHGRYASRTYETRAARLADLHRLAGLPEPADPAMAPLPPELPALARWTEARCVALWRAVRWPQGVACPRCDTAEAVRTIDAQRLGRDQAIAVYACEDCAYHFSDCADSWLHRLQAPLRAVSLVLLAERLHVPRPRLRALGLLTSTGYPTLAARAADSRLAQAYLDRLLITLREDCHAQNHAAL